MREELKGRIDDAKLRGDLRAVLREAAWTVELEESTVEISERAKIDTVARSFHSYEFDIGFGDHFRALLAVGGVEEMRHGIPRAAICFATLWYTRDGALITVDFSESMM